MSAPPPSNEGDDDDDTGPEGCYLTYESDSGGRMMLHYSKGEIPDHAIGFWQAGDDKKIQEFKFKQAGGRSELIKGIAGGDANRRKYFVGWCQFVKLAKQFHGKLIKFPGASQVCKEITSENHVLVCCIFIVTTLVLTFMRMPIGSGSGCLWVYK